MFGLAEAFGIFVAGFFLNAAINLVTALVVPKAAKALFPWFMMPSFFLAVWTISKSEWAMEVYLSNATIPIRQYAVVALLGAISAVVFFGLMRRSADALEKAGQPKAVVSNAPALSPSATPTPGPAQTPHASPPQPPPHVQPTRAVSSGIHVEGDVRGSIITQGQTGNNQIVIGPPSRVMDAAKLAAFSKGLGDIPGGRLAIQCEGNSVDEPCRFGSQIKTVLAGAGWETSLVNATNFPSTRVNATAILKNDGGATAARALAIHRAFKAIGLEIDLRHDPNHPDGRIDLFIDPFLPAVP